MAQIHCKYHSTVPASWFCPTCHINFCTSCIPDDNQGQEPFCTVCKNRAQAIGKGNLITPFWMKPGSFFLYPLHLYPLILLVALTILYAQFDPTLMGKLMQLVITIVFMKYTYAVLEDTALGHIKPLPINAKVINDELELPFMQILLTLAISAANVSVYKHFGFAAFSVSTILTAIAFPANVMVLAMEHSLFSAFNPILVIGVIKRIGPPYFLLAFFLMLLISASSTMMNILYDTVSYSTFITISSFVNMYFTLIMFHLTGYVLYQYHYELGYNLENDAIDTPAHTQLEQTINHEVRPIEILIQEGKTDEANIKLQHVINQNPNNHDAQLLSLKLQQLLGNMDSYNNQAKNYISFLLSQGKMNLALKTLQSTLLLNPAFIPEKAKERLTLAKLLKQNGQFKAAVSLINNLHIDSPNFDKIPEAYLLAAKILYEHLGNDKQAKNILEFLMKKHPNNPHQHEIKESLLMINKLKKS